MNSSLRRRSGETATLRGWATGTPRMAGVLRRGAWYPILQENDDRMVIEVDTVSMEFARDDLIIRSDRPETWSIVIRTGVMRPTLAGPKIVTTYAVCPDCTARQEFEGRPDSLMCLRCRRAAKVDWSATY